MDIKILPNFSIQVRIMEVRKENNSSRSLKNNIREGINNEN